jgi:hypothetical protein
MIVNPASSTVACRTDSTVADMVQLSTETAYQVQILKDKHESENARQLTKFAALFGILSNAFIQCTIYNLFCL